MIIKSVIKNKDKDIIYPQTDVSQVVGLEKGLSDLATGIKGAQDRIDELSARIESGSGGNPGEMEPLWREVNSLKDEVNSYRNDMNTISSDLSLVNGMVSDMNESLLMTANGLGEHITTAETRFSELSSEVSYLKDKDGELMNELSMSANSFREEMTRLDTSKQERLAAGNGINISSDNMISVSYMEATSSTVGLMSPQDKERVDSIDDIKLSLESTIIGVSVDGDVAPITGRHVEIRLDDKYLKIDAPTETWTFTLEDGSQITKEVYVKW